jgi:hypothetical protein
MEVVMTSISSLEYERDFYAWIYHHIALLKQGRWEEIEVDLLIDELESMAKWDRRELISRLMILMAHLLKWQFQAEKRSGSWQGSIDEQRLRLIHQLGDSPSLKHQLLNSVELAYPDALKLACKETKLPCNIFPQACPYTLEQLLDEDFYPLAK